MWFSCWIPVLPLHFLANMSRYLPTQVRWAKLLFRAVNLIVTSWPSSDAGHIEEELSTWFGIGICLAYPAYLYTPLSLAGLIDNAVWS